MTSQRWESVFITIFLCASAPLWFVDVANWLMRTFVNLWRMM